MYFSTDSISVDIDREAKMNKLKEIRLIVGKYRETQKKMLDAIPEFQRMRISYKVTQLEGQIKAIGEMCHELEEALEGK